VTLVLKVNGKLRCLCQRANALGAQCLLNLAASLDNRHFLQIGTISTIGVPLGEGYFIAKCRGFATMSALCHLRLPFLPYNA
jgi:hypothetical protein